MTACTNLSLVTAQAARRHADRIALIDGDRTWRYAELDAQIDQLASGLARRHAPGERVGVMMSNRVEALLLQFALERASLVRVPVNARYTGHELATLMTHCGAAALFFDASTAPAVLAADLSPALACTQVDGGDGPWPALLAHPVHPERLHLAEPGTLATINYTSGTTGRPKGVMLSHANWLAVYRNMLVDRDLRADDVVAYVGPLTHSSGAYFAPWFWRGARNVIVSPPTPARLLDLIEAHGITAFTCVPTFLTRLLAVPGLDQRRLASLRLIGYGAEPIPANTLTRAWQVFGPILWQNYGQTEAMMTCIHLPPELHVDDDAGTPVLDRLGVPYTFVQAVLRDPQGEPVAPGDIGEITIQGDHVMQGYWEQPEETASALRDGWLWTGDLAVQDARGMLRMVGRRKEMLICGGFNIYPGEIESLLTRLDGVRQAAVIARPDPDWGEIAVAFVSLAPDSTLDAPGLARSLQPMLGIKTPKAWRFLDELPRNVNGKIDKQALIRLDRQASLEGTAS